MCGLHPVFCGTCPKLVASLLHMHCASFLLARRPRRTLERRPRGCQGSGDGAAGRGAAAAAGGTAQQPRLPPPPRKLSVQFSSTVCSSFKLFGVLPALVLGATGCPCLSPAPLTCLPCPPVATTCVHHPRKLRAPTMDLDAGVCCRLRPPLPDRHHHHDRLVCRSRRTSGAAANAAAAQPLPTPTARPAQTTRHARTRACTAAGHCLRRGS